MHFQEPAAECAITLCPCPIPVHNIIQISSSSFPPSPSLHCKQTITHDKGHTIFVERGLGANDALLESSSVGLGGAWLEIGDCWWLPINSAAAGEEEKEWVAEEKDFDLIHSLDKFILDSVDSHLSGSFGRPMLTRGYEGDEEDYFS